MLIQRINDVCVLSIFDDHADDRVISSPHIQAVSLHSRSPETSTQCVGYCGIAIRIDPPFGEIWIRWNETYRHFQNSICAQDLYLVQLSHWHFIKTKKFGCFGAAMAFTNCQCPGDGFLQALIHTSRLDDFVVLWNDWI